MERHRFTLRSGLLLALLAIAAPCRAEDFRIASRVYVGDAPEPANETTTLFHGGRVYDFLADPEEISVFDPSRERFLLLNPARREKVEVTVDYATKFTANLKQRGLNRDQKFIRFMVDPRFEVDFDPTTSVLSLNSEWMSYEVQTIAANSPTAAAQYGRYADAYAHLNSLINPAHLPPFARLELNKQLKQRGELPKAVTLTVTRPRRLPGTSKTVVIRTEHHVAWKLLESDRERLEQTGRYLATFRDVTLADYGVLAGKQASR